MYVYVIRLALTAVYTLCAFLELRKYAITGASLNNNFPYTHPHPHLFRGRYTYYLYCVYACYVRIIICYS